MRELSLKIPHRLRWASALAALVAGLCLWPVIRPQAQRSHETPVNITGVTAHTQGRDAVVTVSGDGALAHAQTWQDEEGFHVVLYKGQGALHNLPHGVKARRVGDSLELVVPVKPGSSVYVEPRNNQLDLRVNGGLPTGASESARQSAHASDAEPTPRARAAHRGRQADEQRADETHTSSKRRQQAEPAKAQTAEQSGAAAQRTAQNHAAANAPAQTAQHLAPASAQPKTDAAPHNNAASNQPPNNQAGNSQAASNQPARNQPANNRPNNQPGDQVAAVTPNSIPAGSALAPTPAVQPAPPLPVADEASTIMSPSVLSLIGVTFVGGLGALLLLRRRRQRTAADGWEDVAAGPAPKALVKAKPMAVDKPSTQPATSAAPGNNVKVESYPQTERRKGHDRRKNLGRRLEDKMQGVLVPTPSSTATPPSGPKPERKAENFNAGLPAVVFGAFRIDQEVEKLLHGQPHSIEVLSSRATDDRRAIETSLLKALQTNALGADEKRRARTALEEYGFVARESATLLLADEAYERTTAARVLGQIGSSASLPFLLEALHDPEHVVCTEAVQSLGSLGLPAAIGALLDLARRHPELPAPLLSQALSACSVDCLDFSELDEPGLLTEGTFTGDIDGLEPVAEIEQLPEWLDDPMLSDALERISSMSVEARTAAAQQLAQFQVQRAVEALALIADTDQDATVRATAITSLGIIGHESVFASVLIAMADDAREVRAAAARALSRLSFDRADAYVRVIESGDTALMHRIAQACIKAGLAAKALDRLASEDRRQAYEAFSLLALVVKGGAAEMILQAVEQPGNLGVRLAAARLLALEGQGEVLRRLRKVALGDGAPEKLRNAILEAIYRDDHAAVE